MIGADGSAMISPNLQQHDPHEAVIDGFPQASRPLPAGEGLTLEQLADRFAAETRGGLGPTIDDYALRFPELAAEIREVFPAVVALEQWKLSKEAECLRRNVPRQFPLEQLGDYRLLREIGRGGMGVVFEAAQGPSKRRVAVKVLPWRYGATIPKWRKRFETEVRTISQLKHPNVVEVFGFGEQDGYCYFAMQLVDGVSLDRIIKQFLDADELCLREELHRARDGEFEGTEATAPLLGEKAPQRLRRDSWGDFARLLYQAARGVEFAHQHGVLHNDVKPGNVLVDVCGRVCVGDFGLSRNLQGDLGEAGDDLAGTLRYMAPERFRGNADVRSDVYSLGATLYELVTQTPLFSHPERGSLVGEIEKGAYHPPRRLNPEIPAALETIVLKALEREPGARYPSAQAMAGDLLRFANGQTITAKRRGVWSLFRRLLRPRARLQ